MGGRCLIEHIGLASNIWVNLPTRCHIAVTGIGVYGLRSGLCPVSSVTKGGGWLYIVTEICSTIGVCVVGVQVVRLYRVCYSKTST